MLDSKRTILIKIRTHWTVFQILFTSTNYLQLNSFAWKRDCSVSVKTTNVTKWTKVIQESSYRVVQVTFKWKILKQLLYFLKAVKFRPTFDIQIDITFDYIFENIPKPHLLESPQKPHITK